MTSFAERLDQHVAERRRFGGDWASQARQVRPFVAFADGEGAEWITTALFLRWRERFGNANRETWAQRLSAVRVFAEWLQGIDPRTEVPPKGLIPHRGCRPKPYIYSDGEISRIVAEAARLKCSTGLRASTCSTMFGLMAVTGMRIGEALKLHDGDVDTDGGTVRIGHAKNGRDRVVPVTDCTAERLQRHRDTRDRILGRTVEAFFCGAGGKRLCADAVQRSFAQVGQRTGLREPRSDGRKGRGPRPHDLRHTFATRTITDWFRQGHDVDAEMHKLSAFLGHAGPDSTWWYIEAVPELLELARDRADSSIGKGERT